LSTADSIPSNIALKMLFYWSLCFIIIVIVNFIANNQLIMV